MRQILLGLILCSCWHISIVQAETLSLHQALTLGMQQNFDMRIASLDVERAEAGVLGEQGSFDVTAELGLGVSRSELPADSTLTPDDSVFTKTASADAALSKKFATGMQTRLSLNGESSNADAFADRLDPAYRTYLLLDFTQPLLKDMGIKINTTHLQIARTHRQQAALGYLAEAQQLVAQIELAYFNLAQAEAEYRYATLAHELAKELLKGNQRKLDAGLVAETEVNEARSAVAGREENMLMAEQQVDLARNGLRELIDHGEAQLPENLQAELPEIKPEQIPDLEQSLATGFAQRPELQQAKLELDVRKIALIYADNQLLPRLDLEASLGVNGLAGDDDGKVSRYSGGWRDSAGRAFAQDGHSWYAGLRFSLPLQNRIARSQYRDAAAQDKQSLYRLRRVEVSVEMAIRSAHSSLALGQERLAVARRYAALAETTLNQETKRLKEGLSDTFRVLTFQNSLVTAKLREVAANMDYYRAQSGLALATGTNLENYDILAVLPHEGATP